MKDLLNRSAGKLFPACYTGKSGFGVIGADEYGFLKEDLERCRSIFYRAVSHLHYDIKFWSVYDDNLKAGMRFVPSGNRIVATACYIIHSYITDKEVMLLYDLPIKWVNPVIDETQFMIIPKGRLRLYDRVIAAAEYAHKFLGRGESYDRIKSGLPKFQRFVSFLMAQNLYYMMVRRGVIKFIDDKGMPIYA